jgi:predicted secreted protein
MASAAERGLVLSFYIGTAIEVAEVTDMGDYGQNYADIDVTSHDSSGNAEEFIAGIKQQPEFTLTCNLKTGDTTGQMALITGCAARTHFPFRITLPNADASTFDFTGYVKSYRIKSDLKGVQKITFVIKQDRGAATWAV